MAKKKETTCVQTGIKKSPRRANVRFARRVDISNADVLLLAQKKLPKGTRAIIAEEDPRMPTFFALVEIETDNPNIPAVANGSQLPRVDVDLQKVTRDQVLEQEAEALKTVPKHRHCPICWDGLHGKAQPKQRSWQRVNGFVVKIHYGCDRCGYVWNVKMETHHAVVEVDGVLAIDGDVIPDGSDGRSAVRLEQ